MAPRNRKSKGLTRMDAALDAMRPMGFKADCIRKCVRNLLKVYGKDGWSFIEDSAYKVLIDTMLELPEEPLLEYVPEPLIEGNGDESREPVISEPEPCKEVVVDGEEACPVKTSRFQMLLEEIDAVEVEEQRQKLDAVVAPKLLEEDAYAAQSQDGVYIGFATACPPQDRDMARKTKKPSYGWISDDDEEDDCDN